MSPVPLTRLCTSKSDWFNGCGLLFEPSDKRRTTLCRECKLKYCKELRQRFKFDTMGKTEELLKQLPERPRFRSGVTRIPILVLEPVFAASIALAGRYSRNGNHIQVRPYFQKRGSHDNHPILNWYDVETGTSKKELLITGLWLEEARDNATPYLSGKIGDTVRNLRIEIYRQGDLWAAFYAHG